MGLMVATTMVLIFFGTCGCFTYGLEALNNYSYGRIRTRRRRWIVRRRVRFFIMNLVCGVLSFLALYFLAEDAFNAAMFNLLGYE